jgi:hypothetical protein
MSSHGLSAVLTAPAAGAALAVGLLGLLRLLWPYDARSESMAQAPDRELAGPADVAAHQPRRLLAVAMAHAVGDGPVLALGLGEVRA